MNQETWYLLITELAFHERRHVTSKGWVSGDIATARAHGLRWAREYSPKHPLSEKARAVYETSPHSWKVEVHGSASTHFFTVELARLVA